MPLIGPWEVYWSTDEGEKSITLEPFDSISGPRGGLSRLPPRG